MYRVEVQLQSGPRYVATAQLSNTPRHDGNGGFRNRKDARAYVKYRKELNKDERLFITSDKPAAKRNVTPKQFRVYQRHPQADALSNRKWLVCDTFDKRQLARDYVKEQHRFDETAGITGWQYNITEVKLAQGQATNV